MLRSALLRRVRKRREASAKADPNRAQPRPGVFWQRWWLELTVVFLGVFLAALADDWRERREQRQSAQRLAIALQSSFDDLRRFDRDGYQEFLAKSRRFEADLAAGKRPAYHYERVRLTQRPPTAIWEAFLAADGAKLFPPDVLFDLARFYSAFNNYSDRTIAYYRFLEEEVLPASDDRYAAYVPGTNQLKPRWREQYARLKETSEQLHKLTVRSAELEARIFDSAR